MNKLTIKIETGIPLPPQPRRTGSYGEIKRAILAMKAGDSFLVPTQKDAEKCRHHASDLGFASNIRPATDREAQRGFNRRFWLGTKRAKKIIRKK